MPALQKIAQPPVEVRTAAAQNKPSYYIVLRRFLIMAGFNAGGNYGDYLPCWNGRWQHFRRQSHCSRRSMGVTLSITESSEQKIMLRFLLSHPLHSSHYPFIMW